MTKFRVCVFVSKSWCCSINQAIKVTSVAMRFIRSGCVLLSLRVNVVAFENLDMGTCKGSRTSHRGQHTALASQGRLQMSQHKRSA
jgi:hypothetical protein